MVALVVTLGAAIVLALPAGAGAQDAPPVIALVSPAHNASVPRVKRSPRFTWSIQGGSSTQTLIYRLEVSTDPTFTKAIASENHSCPADQLACWTSHQWNDDWWFRNSDSCTYTPPSGVCRDGVTAKGIYYWRVTTRMSGNTIVSSGVRTLRVVPVADREKPRVHVEAGSARRGEWAYVTAFVSDNSSFVRMQMTLARRGKVWLTARAPFRRIRNGWSLRFTNGRPVPRAWPTGRYTACVSVWDRAGNTLTDCAPYSIR